MKERTHSLDLVKCLAAFLIVFIHSRSYTNGVHTFLMPLTRVAIPLFTMIFMAAIAFPQCGRKTFAATIGRRYSKWIYIYHMMLIPPITSIVSHYPALEPWTPILVFTLATATVALVMGLARIAKPHHAR